MSAIDPIHVRNARVLEHLSLVRRVVNSVHRDIPGGIDRDDLESIAMLGLIEAVDRWDARRGVPFDAFAKHRIKGAIIDAMRAQGWAPRGVRRRGREMEQARDHLAKRLGRAPRVGEVALAMDVPADQVEKSRVDEERRGMLSLDAPISDDGSRLSEVVTSNVEDTEEELGRHRIAERVREACATLPPVEQRAVTLRFYDDMRLREVGELLGVSESRVCQLCKSATDRLRRRLAA